MKRAVLLGALFAGVLGAAPPEVPIPPDYRLPSELRAFRSTVTYEEAVAFSMRLARTSPFMRYDSFGKSGMGRPLPLVIVSKEKAFTPEEMWKTGKPVVLVINSIHGGETDGTDASLLLLRDLAFGRHPEILEGLTLLVVPVYNVDGFSRVSRWNRPNQNGPVDGMGFRANARGLDLNRDYLKLDAPETRALVSLAARHRADLFVDNHVTDGADFRATVTLAYGAEPATARPLADWLDKTVPKATAALREADILTAPYVEFIDNLDPRKGIDAGPGSPRYGTSYFPLRSIPSILVELHAIKPYPERVRANELFLAELLKQTSKSGKALLAAREEARKAARAAAVGSPFTVDSETDMSRPETIDFPAFGWKEEVSRITGRPLLRWDRSQILDLKVPYYRRVKATKTVPRPAAYLVPAGWSGIAERLEAHGIRFTTLGKDLTLPVGTFRASEPKFGASSYQGRVGVTAKIVRGRETRTIPAGSLYVPLDTELAPVAMHLLEPESPDSLFAWGEMSSIFEQREYMDLRVLDPLAEKMLAEDPKLAAEWEKLLADEKLAKDPRARARFFYTKTPYWEETIGLVPTYTLEKPLDAEELLPERLDVPLTPEKPPK
ncbi:MAG: M14 family metallopeptidase [Acidobacteria bacterium]|nr:M14 family metallopeptidase [Acidobacteriota bacterium]